MKRIIGIIIVAAFIFPIHTTQAYSTYTIANPRVVVHKNKHLVQIKWYQPFTRLTMVLKLTQTHNSNMHCSDVDWSEYLKELDNYRYCFDIYKQYAYGDITIQDTKWHQGDRYYLLRYDFTSHNAPYGPIIPR